MCWTGKQNLDLSIMSRLFYHQSTTYLINYHSLFCHFHLVPVAEFKHLTLAWWVECSTTVQSRYNHFSKTSLFFRSFSVVYVARFEPLILLLWVKCSTPVQPRNNHFSKTSLFFRSFSAVYVARFKPLILVLWVVCSTIRTQAQLIQ